MIKDACGIKDEMIRQNYRNHTSLRSVVITDVQKVDSNSFDARLDATGRTYDYYIIAPNQSYYSRSSEAHTRRGGHEDDIAHSFDCQLHNRYMFHQHRAWQVTHPVDIQEMRRAASLLVGEHDFSTFRNSGCQSTRPVRVVQDITVSSTLGNRTFAIVVESFSPSPYPWSPRCATDCGLSDCRFIPIENGAQHSRRPRSR